MAASTSPSETKGRQEVVSLLLLFLAVFLLLGLGSYLVPLLNSNPALQQPNANWCGSFGFFSAHYLFSYIDMRLCPRKFFLRHTMSPWAKVQLYSVNYYF